MWRSHRQYTVYTLKVKHQEAQSLRDTNSYNGLTYKIRGFIEKLKSCLKTESDRNNWRKEGSSKECRLRSNKQHTRLNIGCWSDMQENEEWLHDLNPVVRKTYMSNVGAFCREPEMREVCMALTIIVTKPDNTGYPVMWVSVCKRF